MDTLIDEGCRLELEYTLERVKELEVLDQRNANRIEELEEQSESQRDTINEMKREIRKLIIKTGGGV